MAVTKNGEADRRDGCPSLERNPMRLRLSPVRGGAAGRGREDSGIMGALALTRRRTAS